MKSEHLARGEPALVAKQLGQVADLAARLQVPDRPAQQRALAGGGFEKAEQQLDRGRLARAVGSEKPEDLATRNSHREPGKGNGVPEPFGKVQRLDGGRASGRPFRSGRCRLFYYISHECRL